MRFVGLEGEVNWGRALEAVRWPFEVLEGLSWTSEGKTLMVGVIGTAILNNCRRVLFKG